MKNLVKSEEGIIPLKKNEVADALADHYKETNDLQGLISIMSQLVIENRKFFMEKCYRSMIFSLKKHLKLDQVVEMDRFIFGNYFCYEGEKLLASFEGKMMQKQKITPGRFFLTNYRLVSTRKPYSSGPSGSAGAGGLISRVAVRAINSAIRKKMQANADNLASVLSQNAIGNEDYNFGTQFPITNVSDVQKKRSNLVKYTASITYEQKGKTKTSQLKFKMILLPEDSETKEERQQRTERIQAILEEVLLRGDNS
ncbi:MAG: hypothetical protein ACFFAS_15570 [Promethearchaeota archaeon]